MLLAQRNSPAAPAFQVTRHCSVRKALGLLKSNSHFQKRREELRCLLILKQACSPEYQRAQYAFKDSMIHWILQFTLRIAFRCVLHRCESQEIRCWKLYFELSIHNMFSDKITKVLSRYKSQRRPNGFLHPLAPSEMTLHTRWIWIFESAIKTLDYEWSFRRFTYGNLVTTFTSSKWPSLDNFSVPSCCCQLLRSNPKASLSHSIGSSDGRCVQRAGT